MDKGAHFYRCDLQVHTPRDTNWQGPRAVTEEERRQYAQEFLAACRTKGLQGVAITDHHDLAFFRYIRDAALTETDAGGKPLAEEQRIVVFPGMELTLAVPCQALLLLDADFPADLLPQVVHALSITPAPDGDACHAPTQRLEHVKALEDLYAELNKKGFLRGRFIVFPHVGEDGQFSMLRKGMAARYKNMPCVGGYVDGPVTKLGTGNSDIVAGKSKDWGNKAIAIFQTSDNRSRDFTKLGSDVTWVKWARPTAEALRQACLARHSRIAHTAPKLPAIRITRVEVSNSKFLGPIVLDLNAQYNAVIGGRGTGKSTILEYIRWALCDQPPGEPDDADGNVAEFHKRRQALIEGTLLPLEAVVDISFLLHGVPHIVRRQASGDIQLKIGDAAFQACTEQDVRALLPIRAYSQKQLSAVGARLDELRRFVHAPIQANLDAVADEIAGLGSKLREVFDRVIRAKALQREIAAHEIERRSLSEQTESLRSSLRGVSEEDLAIIEREATFEAELRFVQGLERDAAAARDALAAAALASPASELLRLPATIEGRAPAENEDLLGPAHAALEEWVADAREAIDDLRSVFADPVTDKALAPFFAKLAAWRRRREEHRAKYDLARARAAEHQDTLNQIQTLEGRLAEINETADRKRQQLARLGEPTTDFNMLRSQWKAAHVRRADLLHNQCQKLSAISPSRLRATLRRATDTGRLAERLKVLVKGTKTRGERVDSLVEQISTSGDPMETWHAILDELLELAWLRVEDEAATQLPATPHLDTAGFTRKEKVALARLLEPLSWIELLVFDLKDLPVFDYEVRTADFLPFEKASPGQQATALLSILLLQTGPPLLIDQPEDDLNMKIINEIVETLWRAKAHRQVIFASHNANLVVNGDAELVICCDYRTSGTESGGEIKLTGAIDIPEINREIAEVMEGGVEAFKLRHRKYGF